MSKVPPHVMILALHDCILLNNRHLSVSLRYSTRRLE